MTQGGLADGGQVRSATTVRDAVDGSTGWTAAIGAGTNLFAGYLPESSAKQVFADVDASNASIFAPGGTLVRDQGS